jgi:hypothetical protein
MGHDDTAPFLRAASHREHAHAGGDGGGDQGRHRGQAASDPARYGELVRDGRVLPWLSGTLSGPHVTASS